MGPITLFDKSFLQSLTVDESVWFDHFFYPVISPLFFVETLADLDKAVRQGRTPEQVVGAIARKTPEQHGGLCGYHGSLCFNNLMGTNVPMDGRIPIERGRMVNSDGQKGAVIDVSPEEKAFSRWQKGNFLEVEHQFAHAWRESLSNLDLVAVAASMRAIGINGKTCKSLDDAKKMADSVVCSKDRPFDIMKLALAFIGISSRFHEPILKRWSIAGYPPLTAYAPFVAHVLTVEIFFQIALSAHLISTDRSSNRVDVAYLFYIPFCMLFISSDKLHRRCAPLFLRSNQEFVWGEDLKADLTQLNLHYSKLSEPEKETGIMRFAPYPPETGKYLVSGLWDRHLRPWRGKSLKTSSKDPGKEEKIVERLKKFSKAPALNPEEIDFDAQKLDMLSIEHSVHKRKGSWWQLPKDLKIAEEKLDP